MIILKKSRAWIKSRQGKLALLLFFLLFLSFNLPAQNSRIPKNVNTWLSVTGTSGNGDRDGVALIFFEIPDTVSATTPLYFGIRDPGCDGAAFPLGYDGNGFPDEGSTGTTNYYLLGGSGAYTNANAKLIYHGVNDGTSLASALTGGTQLDTFSRGATNDGWVYFSVVYRNQGEQIGNKYYFRIVVNALAAVSKNAFQAEVSTTVTQTPAGITDVRSFAYNWSLALEDVGSTWEVYPLVDDSATGDIIYHNWDFDSGESMNAYDFTDQVTPLAPAPPVSAGGESTQNYAIGTERGGTWKLEIIENGNPAGFSINTAEVWFTNSVTGDALRAYSDFYDYSAVTPDHVDISYDDGQALADNTDTERVVLQIVDSSGNPIPFSRDLYVTVNNSAVIDQISSGVNNSSNALVTTDSDGLGWLDIRKAAPAASVTVTVYWDGTGNGTDFSDTFGTSTSDTIGVTFVLSYTPAISSDNDGSFGQGAASSATPVITVTDAPGTALITTGNDIRIRIPSGLDCEFDPAFNTPTFLGTASARVAGTVTFESSNSVVVIDVTTNFAVDDTLIISGLQMQNFNSVSSGNLELSYDNGSSYPVSDDKTYSVTANTSPTLSSASNGAFYIGNGATVIPDITITDATVTAVITTTGDIRIQIPAALDCVFNSAITNPIFGGSAAGNVAAAVTYASADKVVVIDVTTNFSASDTLTINGLEMMTFSSVSSSSLVLSYDSGSSYNITDDKTHSIAVASTPVMSDTRAVVGSNLVYVEFNVSVFQNDMVTPIQAANFNYDDSATGSGVTISSISDLTGSNKTFIFTMSSNLSEEIIVADKINAVLNNVRTTAGVYVDSTVQYDLSSIGIEFFRDVKIEDFGTRGKRWKVDTLDGEDKVTIEMMRVEARVKVDYGDFQGAVPYLYYDGFNEQADAQFWDPGDHKGEKKIKGKNVSGDLWEFFIPEDNDRLKNGQVLSFLFKISSLVCYRAPRKTSSSSFSPYDAEAYRVKVQKIVFQNDNVTILNNVIDPRKNEFTTFIYKLNKAGPVSIVIYDLSGNVVKVLKNGNQAKGTHTVLWVGKNNNEKIVARGVYFIRIRGPGIFNQIRKILVIK